MTEIFLLPNDFFCLIHALSAYLYLLFKFHFESLFLFFIFKKITFAECPEGGEGKSVRLGKAHSMNHK